MKKKLIAIALLASALLLWAGPAGAQSVLCRTVTAGLTDQIVQGQNAIEVFAIPTPAKLCAQHKIGTSWVTDRCVTGQGKVFIPNPTAVQRERALYTLSTGQLCHTKGRRVG